MHPSSNRFNFEDFFDLVFESPEICLALQDSSHSFALDLWLLLLLRLETGLFAVKVRGEDGTRVLLPCSGLGVFGSSGFTTTI